MSCDPWSARKTRDMSRSPIAQRRVRDFSECSKMPIKYGFSARLTFCAIAASALSA
jgi:hypothetical protein